MDVHVTAADGNVSDAVVLSALAALLAFRCPAVSLGGPDDRSANASDPLFSLCRTQFSCCHSPQHPNQTTPASHQPWPLIMPGKKASLHGVTCQRASQEQNLFLRSQIIVHSPDEKESVPLSIHHLPFSITFAVFEVRQPCRCTCIARLLGLFLV